MLTRLKFGNRNPITAYVDDEILQKMIEERSRTGESESEFIRSILTEYFELGGLNGEVSTGDEKQ